mmetsp:Transcript_9004/g.8397  ORF Transcript_9004/g.8397 Transcript_9004/m.8397 type:complete len:136 (-) Transcript_9004:671-1078(-)
MKYKYYTIYMAKVAYEGKLCLLMTVRDITDQKIFQEKQLIDSVKTRIFKSFTHELKSPLNFLMMSFDLMQNYIEEVEVEDDESVATINKVKSTIETQQSCAIVLKNIINDFMDYSILCGDQKNQFKLNETTFELH